MAKQHILHRVKYPPKARRSNIAVQTFVASAERRAHVSWAEIEVPNAPRRAFVSWAELEVPNGPRRAFVSWAELEVPTAPRRAQVSWAEFEAPTAPRRALVSWAELETPNGPRRAFVSWAELEVPDALRRAQISWAEVEVPDAPAPRRAYVSWAEIETPNGPRRAILSWAELEVPSLLEEIGGTMAGFTIARYDDSEQFQPLAFVTQTVAVGAAVLAAVPSDARGAIISGDGSANAVRYRFDGGVPTATVGLRMEGTDTLVVWSRAALLAMQVIREDAADVVISVQFFS